MSVLDLVLIAVVSFVASFFGAYLAIRLVSTDPKKEIEAPRTPRAPIYQTPAKAAAYMASVGGPKKLPGAWIDPRG